MAQEAAGPRFDYIVGKTLIHFDLHEGPTECPKVTPIFSIPKNMEHVARLIAAAPELLAAARAALDLIGICCSDTNNKNWHAQGCAVPMLRAAILRAEGK